MATSIIKFFTGTTYQLQRLTNSASQYIALNTQTGQMYWNHDGIKYYMNYVADWNASDSAAPNFIKNKPAIPTIADFISNLDVSQLQDVQHIIVTYRLPITQNMIRVNNGHYTVDLGNRHPKGIITSTSMYSIDQDSVTLHQDNTITLQLNNYMAYQNVTTVPNNWAVYYA